MLRRLLSVALAATSASALPAATGPSHPFEMAGTLVQLELAHTAKEQQRGLMFRRALAPDHGMLFAYSGERRLCMWMRNTPIALDAAFVKRSGEVVTIAHMAPFSDDKHCASRPVSFVIEMSEGWFSKHNITVGSTIPNLVKFVARARRVSQR